MIDNQSPWLLPDDQAQTLREQMGDLYDRLVADGHLDPDDDPDPDEFTPADEMRIDAQRYDRRYGSRILRLFARILRTKDMTGEHE